jgi:preprotein translocase subunit SecA
VIRYNVLGRPVLLGTTSVELSERISNRLRAEPMRRLAMIHLLRNVWMEQHKREEDGRAIPELELLNQPIDQLPINDMRKLARELDIPFNAESPENLPRLLRILELSEAETDRLSSILQAGIPHQVLNARKHTEESQIIAGAGAYGAVTIATNAWPAGSTLSGRQKLAEGSPSPSAGYCEGRAIATYDMTLEEQSQALLAMDHPVRHLPGRD